jgi:hypothetical protein
MSRINAFSRVLNQKVNRDELQIKTVIDHDLEELDE